MTSSLSPQLLAEARLQLHYAIQPIAATGAALAAPQPDDSHSTLQWDASLNCFAGSVIQAEQAFRVALDPVNLALLVFDGKGAAIAELPLAGKTLAQAMEWLKDAIAPLGPPGNPVQLLSYPADDFPDHPIAHGAPFDAAHPEARAALVEYFATTHALLQEIVTTKENTSSVRIWPHHFDIATLITRSVQSDVTYTIGVGLSPGDASYSEPYWYVGPYPYPDVADLPPLGSGGVWHTQHWVGAVLTASMLNQNVSENQRIEQIRGFLNRAIEILSRQA